jgi:hypothetical protein
MVITGFGQFTMMWFLHVATYYYILDMQRLELTTKANLGPLPSNMSVLSPGYQRADVSWGSLQDIPEMLLPTAQVPLTLLDAVASLLPVLFLFGCIYSNDLMLWTKVLWAHAWLAIVKGLLDMLTVMPDSSGWNSCQHRLTATGVQAMEHLTTSTNFFTIFIAIGEMELFGPKHDRFLAGIRYCSDMMVSGHTFVTCLYALGFLELIHRMHVANPSQYPLRYFIAAAIFVLCEQAIEISLVIITRFHYSADILSAVVITFLLYTNAPLVIYAKWWSQAFGDLDTKHEGTIWVPPCCIPFCDLKGTCNNKRGQHKLVWEDDEAVMEEELLARCFGRGITNASGGGLIGFVVAVDVGEPNAQRKNSPSTSFSGINTKDTGTFYQVLIHNEEKKDTLQEWELKWYAHSQVEIGKVLDARVKEMWEDALKFLKNPHTRQWTFVDLLHDSEGTMRRLRGRLLLPPEMEDMT